jgi:V8-like Glu-specific endopeptidase
MKSALFLAFFVLSVCAPLTAQTERVVDVTPPAETVTTRTYVKDGKTVTERVTTTVQKESETVSRKYKAAIFVSNSAGAAYDTKLGSLEDYVTARVSDLGVSVLSRELMTASARKFDPATASSARPDSSLDAALSDQSSALRIAQGLGADYILSTSLTALTKQKRNINAYGVQLANYDYTLRLSYKLVDAHGGGSLTGGVVTATKTEQNTVHANQGFRVVAADPSTPAAAPGSEAANADEALMRYAKQYEKAIGVVLTAEKEGSSIGTAWGIGPNAFATNAHVAGPAAQAIAAGRSVRVFINKHTELTYRVVKATIHPRYGRTEAGIPINDVGILEVEGNLAAWFPVASAKDLQNLDSGYRVAYLGFPSGENMTAVDPRSPVATMQTGIVTSVTDWQGGVGTPENRLLVQHNLSSTGGASGSPVFNAKGQVIALHNAGNYSFGVVTQGGKKVEQRLKSGLQIGYAQRADLLADIYQGSTSTGSSGASSTAAPKATVAVAFLDPDLEPVLDELLADATTQLTEKLRVQLAQNRVAEPAAKAGPVAITVNVETADLYVPDVRIGPEKTVSIQDGKLTAAPLNVSVEIDGVAVGSAPGKVSIRPGFSKLRLTREGYIPWERTINAYEGQTLTVAMQMTPAGLARWKDLTVFMNTLINGAKLTDAEVEILRGKAQQLRQSGYMINVNTTAGLTFQNRSIFGL